jgi:hypothetical protein
MAGGRKTSQRNIQTRTVIGSTSETVTVQKASTAPPPIVHIDAVLESPIFYAPRDNLPSEIITAEIGSVGIRTTFGSMDTLAVSDWRRIIEDPSILLQEHVGTKKQENSQKPWIDVSTGLFAGSYVDNLEERQNVTMCDTSISCVVIVC